MLTSETTFGVPELRKAFPEIHKESVQASSKPKASSTGTEPNQPRKLETSNVETESDPILAALAEPGRELSISLEPATNKIVVRIVNSETKEVIKQIPPKELLALSENLKKIGGALFDETA